MDKNKKYNEKTKKKTIEHGSLQNVSFTEILCMVRQCYHKRAIKMAHFVLCLVISNIERNQLIRVKDSFVTDAVRHCTELQQLTLLPVAVQHIYKTVINNINNNMYIISKKGGVEF